MTFQEGGSFGGGRVRTRSGGRTAAVGGGIGALVVALAAIFFNVNLSPVVDGVAGGQESEGSLGECSAAQANEQRDCRLSATLDALDTYWTAELASGGQLQPPDAVSFTMATTTACGQASSSTGPFYCPPDQTIYLDLGFYDLLQSQFGSSGGPLAEIYVTAHEYGHHIQHVTGIFDRADRSGTGAGSDSVRLELQADCYAGLFIGHAATTTDPDTGVTYLEPITQDQLADALSAAQAVGDDHIQQQSGGGVNQDTWTHGSSEQRERWFTTGYEQGTLQACDTFAASSL
jgi:predicted metalloprotease